MVLERKLIIEQPNYNLEFLSEQQNANTEKRMYIKGQYIMMNRYNKNRRMYSESEMVPAVEHYIENCVKTGSAGGELNHSDKPDTDLARLADRIISLERDKSDPDYYIGKSLVLNTPSGKILQTLVEDGIRVGKSTKVLGRIEENTQGNEVKSPIICLVDNVWEPSVSSAYVSGILENKSYIIGDDGKIAEAYGKLERNLSKYPSKHSDAIRQHIMESLEQFLKSL